MMAVRSRIIFFPGLAHFLETLGCEVPEDGNDVDIVLD